MWKNGVSEKMANLKQDDDAMTTRRLINLLLGDASAALSPKPDFMTEDVKCPQNLLPLRLTL